MRKLLVICSLLTLGLALFVSSNLRAQDKSKRPSPPAQAKFDLGGGATITIDYSSPRVKGRKIFGELVPYGQVWRTGANEATTFVASVDLTVGGAKVPAGSYTLFTIPDKDKWTLIISKKTGEWGTNYPGPSEDLVRVEMKASSLPKSVEDFTISFDKTGAGATLNFDWDTTRASVAITKK